MRNVLVIATNTTREIIRQPAFLLVLVLGAAALLLGRYMTLFALGEEVSMFKDIGTSTILLVGLLIVVFASTTTIHEEIENRTILTLLSRPVSRAQLLLGKYLGLAAAVAAAFVLLLGVFLVAHWWMLHYEYNFSDKTEPFVSPQIVKAVYLAFLQVLLLGGVAMVASIYLALLPNMALCGLVFVAGHLSDYVFAVFRDPETLRMHPVARFFYLLIPNLEHFNVSSALVTGTLIPGGYLTLATLYTLVYLTALLTAGVLLFNRRELL